MINFRLFLLIAMTLNANNSFAENEVANCKDDVQGVWCEVPSGKFLMGSPENEVGRLSDEVQRQVTIPQPFEMQATEVTQRQWFNLMGYNPSYYYRQCRPSEYLQVNGVYMCAQNPVEWVTAEEVQTFINKLNAAHDGYNYRLPTEEEWEYAARAGTTGPYGGSGDLNDMAWYRSNSGNSIQPVGKKMPNAFGLYDMHGNVWERTSTPSRYAGWGVIRGGGWMDISEGCRSARRALAEYDEVFNFVGFRLVRTPVL